MTKSNNRSTSVLGLAFLLVSLFTLPLFSALSVSTLKDDLSFYRKESQTKKLDANGRYYILLKLESKYESSGVDLSPLHAEIKRINRFIKNGQTIMPDETAPSKTRRRSSPARKSSATAGVSRIVVSEKADGSQVIVTADNVARFNYFTLKDPEPNEPTRVVLDLYGVKEHLADKAKDITLKKGLFARVQAAQFEDEPNNIVRVVAQLRSEGPYRVRQAGNQWIITALRNVSVVPSVASSTGAAVVAAPAAAGAPSTTAALPAAPTATPPATAVAPPEHFPPKEAGTDDSLANYRIEAGDILSVSVYPADELSREVIVQPDGKFSFPLIGSAQGKGMTPKELERSLSINLGRFIARPQITVTVKQFSRRQIFVTGEVHAVGAYNYKENLRLMEFISSAGGFTDNANRREIKVYRGPPTKRQIHSVNIEEIVRTGDFSKDFLLEPGDIIEVPKGQTRVAILGDVRSPGYYDYRDDLRLLELVSLAGGFSDTAEISRVNIIHQSGEKNQAVAKVNLKKILSGEESDVSVQTGDTVYIPKKNIASANWFVNNILPWASLLSLVIVMRGGI